MRVVFMIAIVLLVVLGASADNKEQKYPAGAEKVDGYRKSVSHSKHDLTAGASDWAPSCNACHIPHVQGVRPTTQPATQPAVEMYHIRGQRRVFVPGRYMPGPTSLICLGCHDGTVATSTISSSHALLAGIRQGFQVPDGFVWRDHPIGVPYPKKPKEYRPESFVLAKGKVRLPQGRIECVSCHDPHNASGFPKMLVTSNRRSALCLNCHVK